MTSDEEVRKRQPTSSTDEPQTQIGERGKTDGLKYKRQIGLVGGVSFIVGSMIGSGIFISPKGVVLEMGTVGGSLVVWLAGGVVAILAGICYTELGTMIRESGGDYTYLRVGLGGPVAFVFSWQTILALRPSSAAVISLTCAQYILTPFFDDGCGNVPETYLKCLAILVICVVAFINCASALLATRIQIIFTVAKVVALIIIIIGGIVRIAQGNTEHFQDAFEGTTTNLGKIGVALYNCLWSYEAWNALNTMTEEVINVKRNLPLSILIGVPLVTVLYILANVSYFTVMSVSELLASPAVALTWAETVITPVAWLMPLSVALSTFGTVNGSMFGSGRASHAASLHGHTIDIFSMIHIKRYTPVPPIVCNALLGCIFILTGNVLDLISFLSFAGWITNGLVYISLIVMRFTKPNAKRPIKIPIVVPFLMLIISCFLVLAPLIGNPRIQYLYASLFIVGGLIFYVPFVHFKIQPPFMTYITAYLQIFFGVCPGKKDQDFNDIIEVNGNAIGTHDAAN